MNAVAWKWINFQKSHPKTMKSWQSFKLFQARRNYFTPTSLIYNRTWNWFLNIFIKSICGGKTFWRIWSEASIRTSLTPFFQLACTHFNKKKIHVSSTHYEKLYFSPPWLMNFSCRFPRLFHEAWSFITTRLSNKHFL